VHDDLRTGGAAGHQGKREQGSKRTGTEQLDDT
jgi:hypothetical protein